MNISSLQGIHIYIYGLLDKVFVENKLLETDTLIVNII